MSRDQLRHLQMLIETGQIEEARAYLKSNAADPNIQKLLDDFNQQHPPPPSELEDLFELGGETDQKKLAQAQRLLQINRFADARKLLNELQHMPKARQWLQELNELEAELRREASEGAGARPVPDTPAQAIGDFVRSINFRLLIGALIIMLSVVIIVGFFAFPIAKSNVEVQLSIFAEVLDVDINPSPHSCTAFNIWRGQNTCQHTFAYDTDLAQQTDSTGIISVRLIDRSLMLMPIVAIVLIIVAWLYIVERIDAVYGLLGMAGVAIGLLLYPMLWQSISDNVGTNADLARTRLIGGATSLINLRYNATEHMIVAGLVVGVCIVALTIMMVELAGLLGIPRNLLTAKGELEPDLLNVFAERKRIGR